ncbi:hypothetical protein AB205_0063150 [Aquarana catesbeiana]|uniref:Uncharacterized protein n=1 Tax=Aquarana catesbeiana TaxID=8400 RepID=A0A2G9SB45_AQUCT|nr:hypothetical protein AB205_0063150 [Aquarana catesbeiana]
MDTVSHEIIKTLQIYNTNPDNICCHRSAYKSSSFGYSTSQVELGIALNMTYNIGPSSGLYVFPVAI